MFLLVGERWFGGEIQAAVYNLGLILRIASELCIFFVSGRSDKKDRHAAIHDRMSIGGIIAANIISCLLALFGAQYLQVKLTPTVAWVGIAFLCAGIVLRVYSVLTLQKFFTVSVEIKTGHKIIRKGPYRYLRHPSYSGSVLSLLGMQMGIRSLIGFIATAAIAAFAYGYRIHVEETAMADNFGAEYEIYKEETKRLIPFIF